MPSSRFLRVAFVFLCTYGAQAQVSTAAPSLTALPEKGLAGHDFLYAGESHDRKVFLVRHGKIDWSYDDPQGKGEISDAVLLSNGNLLIAHQYGVKLISPEKKILGAMIRPRAMKFTPPFPSVPRTCSTFRTATPRDAIATANKSPRCWRRPMRWRR